MPQRQCDWDCKATQPAPSTNTSLGHQPEKHVAKSAADPKSEVATVIKKKIRKSHFKNLRNGGGGN